MTATERPTPVGPVATRAGVSRDTARNKILRDHPDALAVTALRTKSLHAREVLVEAAWPGRSAEEIDAWATPGAGSPGAPRTADLPAGADAFHLGQLARVYVLQTADPADVARGRAILEALAATGGLDAVHPQAVLVLLHLRLLDRDDAGCRQLLEHAAVPADAAAAVRADLANPFLGGDGSEDRPARWLALLDDALHSDALAPLRLDPEPGAPFDRLTTDPLPRADVDGDRLVTVAMSTFRPGRPLLTAVRSLLAQTWQHLEILVVDDASGPEAEPWLRQAETLDPRVRVIRKSVNGGTYRARNTALRQARGSYFTTLDSDDWLHPQAVATLVRALEADPGLVATRALGARVDEQLGLVRLGYRHRAVAAPTLMVRLDPALARVGFFDPTRKSADTEYARRLQAAFGRRSVSTVDECLLLLRSGDTLSSAEFSRMWRHPARHTYKALYTPWHEEIAAGATAYLDPLGPRAFPEPRRWRRSLDPALPGPRHLDLVLGGDWRRYGGPQRSMIEEARAAREAGLRVGVLHLEALRFATTQDLPLCAPVTEMVRRGEVEWVQVDDDVDVDVLMVRYPLVLQHPPHVPGGRRLRPRHLLVVANQSPLEPDGSDQRYVVADVTARAEELFGVAPVWVPQGPVVRDVLRDQDPTVALTRWDNPGLIDVAEWHVRDDRAPGAGGAPVVVGRYSRDHPLKFPAAHADLVAAYDLGPGYVVRLMGARATWKRLAAEAGLPEDTPTPQGWELLRSGSVDPRELLAGLDFFLYQDHPGRHEAFGRVLLEAAASGVLVVAHPKHRRVFGEVLDYALPEESRGVIEGYVAEPDRYRTRVARVQELVRERYSHASFVRRLADLPAAAASSADATPAPTVGAPAVPRGRHDVVLRTAADATHADVVTLELPDAVGDAALQRVGEVLATTPDGRLLEELVSACDQDGEIAVVQVRRQVRMDR